MSVMSTARVAMPAVSVAKKEKKPMDISSAVKGYGRYAQPNFQSLGEPGRRVLIALSIAVIIGTGNPHILATAITLFAIAKSWGQIQETRYIHNEVVPSIKAAEDPAEAMDEVRQALPGLEPSVQERLVNRLEENHFSLLDIPLAAANFARKALHHVLALGGGRNFALVSIASSWAAILHPHIVGVAKHSLSGALKTGAILTILLWGIGKLIGIVRQRLSARTAFRQVKTDADKPALRQAIKEQNLAPRSLRWFGKRYEERFKERWS